jgi:hypothetical protein
MQKRSTQRPLSLTLSPFHLLHLGEGCQLHDMRAGPGFVRVWTPTYSTTCIPCSVVQFVAHMARMGGRGFAEDEQKR